MSACVCHCCSAIWAVRSTHSGSQICIQSPTLELYWSVSIVSGYIILVKSLNVKRTYAQGQRAQFTAFLLTVVGLSTGSSFWVYSAYVQFDLASYLQSNRD